MITEYKGITQQQNPYIFCYISTYHILDRENYESYLDDDNVLQKLVNRHYVLDKAFIILFNIGMYGFLYGTALLMGG